MRKFLMFSILAIVAVMTSQAQEIRFGVKGGLNIADIGGDGYSKSLGARASVHVGGLMEIPIKGNFALQPEILYSSEGARFGWDYAVTSKSTVLDYIRIPILGKYYILQRLSAEAGPVFGLLIGAKQGGLSDIPIDSVGNYFSVKSLYNDFDVGIAVGATYTFDMGVFFSLRYNKGLINIIDDDVANYKNQNNVFQISAGYSF